MSLSRRALLALAALPSWPVPRARAGAARIVSVGAAVTETVCALGAAARLVAVDSTSLFPAAVRALPKVGYFRALAPEGLLALRADLLLLSDEAGPPQAIEVLRAAGAPLRILPAAQDGEGAARRILAVAAALELDGAPLAEAVRADWRALDAPIAALPPRPAIFVLSVARGAPLVAGARTQADAMLRAAGAANVVQGFEGYRPLSPEAAARLAPEVAVLMSHALAEAGGAEALLRLPAFAVTPLARGGRIIGMDGAYLLGFGPRAAQARRDLARLLHPQATLPELPPRPWT